MIPAQTAAQIVAATTGPLGYVAPLLAVALLIARGMYVERRASVLALLIARGMYVERHASALRISRVARVGMWLVRAVVVTGFAALLLRLLALTS
jgi:hypothetical protein